MEITNFKTLYGMLTEVKSRAEALNIDLLDLRMENWHDCPRLVIYSKDDVRQATVDLYYAEIWYEDNLKNSWEVTK